MKFLLVKTALVISIVFTSACSSHFDSNKPDNNAGTAQLSAQQKKAQLAELSTHLQGTWLCSGTICLAETLTFDSTLDQLTIENSWHQCRVHTDYQLSVGQEDADGMTEFTIHASGLGQLIGNSATNENCKDYLTSFSNKPLDENFSFTHNSDWSLLTIGEGSFARVPAPVPSLTPSPVQSSNS